MSAPNSPRTSPRKGKYLECKILLLDDSWQQFWIHPKSPGQALFEEVVKHLQLLESDYFDLEFKDPEGFCSWLDHEKPVLKQMAPPNMFLKLLVKFYTPDPGLLEEEYTRYLFALQVKRDLETGAMPCQEHTAVLLASYVVQSELGDFLDEEYLDHSYLTLLKLLPQQTDSLLIKIMEHHREHVSQTPEQADFNLLDTARKVELYGIRMHPSKDHEGVLLQLACAHMGVLVFQNYTKINTFSWAKVRKLSFKRKKFLIKLHPEGYGSSDKLGEASRSTRGYYKDTVEFYFESRNECKNFWKKCIEHHAFFRCHSVKRVSRNKTRVVSRGSSFRYSGRTQKQLVEFVRENFVKRPPFERTTSLRTVSSTRSAAATPKTGTLNSRDIHFSRESNQNPSTSSGSHTIDMSRSNENMMDSTRAEVHDESFNSISRRSRGSPRRDRSYDRSLNRSLDRALERGQNHYQVSPPVPPPRDDYQRQADMDKVPSYNEVTQQQPMVPPYNELSPRIKRLDPNQFMLSQQDRKLSAPQFPLSQQDIIDERHLARSPEVENIPEHVHVGQSDDYGRTPPSLHRSQSATSPNHHPMDSPPQQHDSIPRHQDSIPRHQDSMPHHQDSIPRHQDPHQRQQDSLPRQQDSVPRHYEQPSRFQYPTQQEEEVMPPPPPPIYEEESRSPRDGRQKAWVAQRLEDTYVSRSTTSAASVTLTSSMSVPSSRGTEESEEDSRRKRSPADKAYYIAKELLMTERTYKKDLELITVWFRQAVSQEDTIPEHLMELLFLSMDPLFEYHVSFLKEIEQRLAMWEGKSNAHLNGEYKKIGDVILNNLRVLQLYCDYMEKQDDILTELELAIRHHKPFEHIYREFESQKVCYLPLNTFLLKPAQRLLHYQLILERLVNHYNSDHADFEDCTVCLEKIKQVTMSLQDKLQYLENKQKLIELQRDLVGVDSLVLPNRQFIREGCLQKLSRKGYQQRMFFLFSDMLVYTSRTATPSLQFKVHGQLPLRGMIVEETDPKMAVANSFTIYGGNRCLLVAASCQEERDKWLEDLQGAINYAKDHEEDSKILYPSLKSNSSSEALEDSLDEKCPPSPDRQVQHRANTTMHVCWHRNTSVSMKDHNVAVENQLSGYLLRKFKNSNGWQKLWVVFTNFCLFFYKTYQDDFPLASLPLLGYSVTTPTEADGIHKDYVFKLQFKNHVYFFRAESEYTFERWIEVIQSATESSRKYRILSRVDSQQTNNT